MCVPNLDVAPIRDRRPRARVRSLRDACAGGDTRPEERVIRYASSDAGTNGCLQEERVEAGAILASVRTRRPSVELGGNHEPLCALGCANWLLVRGVLEPSHARGRQPGGPPCAPNAPCPPCRCDCNDRPGGCLPPDPIPVPPSPPPLGTC